jgi:hypothetical protein
VRGSVVREALIFLSIVVGLAGAALLVRSLSDAYARPRFVVALALAATVVGIVELAGIFGRPLESYEQVWFGYQFYGKSARLAAIPHVVLYLVGAWGLWQLRSWARMGAMAYLAYMLVSFVIWGVRDHASEGVRYVMAWQIFIVPFVTFCFMYLQRGAKHFH